MGTSFFHFVCSSCVEDHPHACGDKYYPSLNYSILQGSSPRVWGQDLSSKANYRISGIIPTRVGTSVFFTFLSVRRQDHPHACGDKLYQVGCFNRGRGSSPRVWGQVVILLQFSNDLRIIPTRVGTRTGL